MGLIVCTYCGFVSNLVLSFVYLGDNKWQCKKCHSPNSSTVGSFNTGTNHSVFIGIESAIDSNQEVKNYAYTN
jgi:hypothetical protein